MCGLSRICNCTVGRVYYSHVDCVYNFWVFVAHSQLMLLKITLHTIMHLICAILCIILTIAW